MSSIHSLNQSQSITQSHSPPMDLKKKTITIALAIIASLVSFIFLPLQAGAFATGCISILTAFIICKGKCLNIPLSSSSRPSISIPQQRRKPLENVHGNHFGPIPQKDIRHSDLFASSSVQQSGVPVEHHQY